MSRSRKEDIDVTLLDYQTEYLTSSLWKKIRKRILLRDEKKCVFCKGTAKVVHHRIYSREVLEGIADEMLVSLCNACHEYIHISADGTKRSLEETDQILVSGQPPNDFPEPSVDLRRLPYRELPVEWLQMNHIQQEAWQKRYSEIRRAKRAELNERTRLQEERRKRKLRDSGDSWMSLQEAIQLYGKEKGAPSNSYNWYRNSAMHDGYVCIGKVNLKAEKRRGTWCVESDQLFAAIAAHHELLAHRARMTEDYRNGVLHGNDGDIIQTDWGHYMLQGKFHSAFSTHSCLSRGDGDSIICNECFRLSKIPIDVMDLGNAICCTNCGREIAVNSDK